MKTDTITKEFVKDTGIFADIFNYYVYGGRQVIQPGQLTERDTVKTALPYGADGASFPVQRFRDVQKLYASMTDGKAAYILYGVENQTRVHYAMAVKNNLYDALEYAGQVEEAARSHRRQKGAGTAPSAGEFLSGFWAGDRLIPSVTVTLFFGAEEWDGPLSLSAMMDVPDPDVHACMNDYKVHLIAPARMADTEIMKFQSSMREVLLFIKYSKNRDGLDRILQANEKRFRGLERRAADVIEAVTKSGLKYDKGEEAIDMCQAIQEMRMEERRIGKEEGKRIGREEGERIGETKQARETSKRLYAMGLGIEAIASAVGHTAKTVMDWLGLMSNLSDTETAAHDVEEGPFHQ